MNIRAIRWSVVIPWALLGVVLSCGGAAIAPATSPPQASTGTFTSIDTQEIVLRGKDGKVRGKLTGESLSLSDSAGNKVDVALGAAAMVTLTSASGGFKVALHADNENAGVFVVTSGNIGMFSVSEKTADLTLTAAGRKISAGIETERPLADLEFFDANDKRRASFGLNSNGEPRVSLYDENETRRLYGILTEDVPVLDLNDKTGAAAVELFGSDAKRGSGVSFTHNAHTSNVGIGADGKPLR